MALLVPMAVAATSPLLEWRQPVYIAAGFAGVVGLALLLVQPLLAGGYLPGIALRRSRWLHRLFGIGLVAAVGIHVAGLWITSPPDVVDALLFRSPTPFSVWGVVAMWAVFAVAVLAAFRRSIRMALWRRLHLLLTMLIVAGTVVHAVLIEGTMGVVSKAALCALVIVAASKIAVDKHTWLFPTRSKV